MVTAKVLTLNSVNAVGFRGSVVHFAGVFGNLVRWCWHRDRGDRGDRDIGYGL